VVFNDLTKLLLLADGHNIHYIDNEGKIFIPSAPTSPPYLPFPSLVLLLLLLWMNMEFFYTPWLSVKFV